MGQTSKSMLKIAAFVLTLGLAAMGAASAQKLEAIKPDARIPTFQGPRPDIQAVQQMVQNMTGQVSPDRQKAAPQAVRIQTSITLFFAGPTDQSAEADKARENARTKLYEMSGRECEFLLKSIAKECTLLTINVTMNAQNRNNPGAQDGYNASAMMSYQIIPKSAD